LLERISWVGFLCGTELADVVAKPRFDIPRFVKTAFNTSFEPVWRIASEIHVYHVCWREERCRAVIG
jgi:hypothetical protein